VQVYLPFSFVLGEEMCRRVVRCVTECFGATSLPSSGSKNKPASCTFLICLFFLVLNMEICPTKRRLTYNDYYDGITQKTELVTKPL
jgi:hypothetical protein